MRNAPLLVLALGCMVGVAALAKRGDQQGPAPQRWFSKADKGASIHAVLLELGVKDATVRDWSGSATLQGGKIVRREGYRFRASDTLLAGDAWKASSHRALRAPKGTPAVTKFEPNASVGIVFHLDGAAADSILTVRLQDGSETKVPLDKVLAGAPQSIFQGGAVVRLVSAAEPVADFKTEDDYPAAAYGPDGTLYVVYNSYTVHNDDRRIEAPALESRPKDFKAFYQPAKGDQVWLRCLRAGKWSEPIAVSGPQQDIVRAAVAVDGTGQVWVVFGAGRDGNFDLYGRRGDARDLKFAPEVRLTSQVGPDLTPVMATDAAGKVWLAWQAWNDKGLARIGVMSCAGDTWSEPRFLQGPAKIGNCWSPAIAASPKGEVAVAFDHYDAGDYDVHVAVIGKDGNHSEQPIASTPKFEARPSLLYDQAGSLWIAYEEGPVKWGKDYGALDAEDGSPLFNERSVKVNVLFADALISATHGLPVSKYQPPRLPFDGFTSNKYERVTRYAYPKLGMDGSGNVWLAYRQSFGSRYATHPGSYWLSFVRRFEHAAWSPPVELHHSDGLLDSRPVLLPNVSGGLLTLHNTDGRYTTPHEVDNHIFASVVALPKATVPKDVKVIHQETNPHQPGEEVNHERAVSKAFRDYRVEHGGKKYRLLRGEYHRHTEISWDGGSDGSLEDMFRYAIDAAGMEWIGNGDHDNGAGREYPWWLTQKLSDAYHVAGCFTPMFTYERSVPYPHGHRNVMFAKRGMLTLPRLLPPKGEKAPGGVHADDTKMLYRYLHELGGICAVHTSATGMGTDWRDNDADVEPIVEIYQGDRMSYEMEGAPRAGYDPQSGVLPANVAGWYPKGFIDRALKDRGYKLGFQASSDHWSTHISFFVVLAENQSREAILDAVKRRRCYGATDSIIVDFRSGKHVMGEEMKSLGPPSFQFEVHGTGALKKIDILRDSEVVKTIAGKGSHARGEWTDPNPASGSHYYYIRILQADNEIAWSSPIWVR